MPKETILVVDDERLVRWSLQQKLEQWGYHVSLAEDGATALGRMAIRDMSKATVAASPWAVPRGPRVDACGQSRAGTTPATQCRFVDSRHQASLR